MTDTGSAAARPETSDFFTLWANTLSQVLGEIGGTPVACATLSDLPRGSDSDAANDFWVSGAFSGALRGEIALRLPPASTALLARLFVGEPASPEEQPGPDSREAVIELLRQVGGLVVTPLRRDFGDVQLHMDSSSAAPSWPASSAAWLQVGEASAGATIQLQLSAAVTAALRGSKPETPSVPATPSPEKAVLNDAVKLDLLMDVELGVTLRFGSRRMLLKDILELSPGSVIELDRQVRDPVDMLLDGHVIARGEIVVLDGNYGLQVTQVGPAE
ncbi:MAG TPA: flagellar motor switch protein FliN [Candidatus Sulfotelmatobacter sp.]|nr:flagellar motor switch protein FliN [Candidatus Sulfotelmatobacter sp.]